MSSSLFLKIGLEKELEKARFFVSIRVGSMAEPLISYILHNYNYRATSNDQKVEFKFFTWVDEPKSKPILVVIVFFLWRLIPMLVVPISQKVISLSPLL